jgi:hypothetical protein
MPRGDSQRIKWEDFITDQELKEMYEVKKWSLMKMSSELFVSELCISKKLKSLGVELRVSGRNYLVKKVYAVIMSSTKLLNTPRKELAEKYGCSVSTVSIARRKVFDTFNIYGKERRKKKCVFATVNTKGKMEIVTRPLKME